MACWRTMRAFDFWTKVPMILIGSDYQIWQGGLKPAVGSSPHPNFDRKTAHLVRRQQQAWPATYADDIGEAGVKGRSRRHSTFLDTVANV